MAGFAVARVSSHSPRGKRWLSSSDVEIHVVAHVALRGLLQRLEIPREVAAVAQRLVDHPAPRLAGAHLGVEGVQIPAPAASARKPASGAWAGSSARLVSSCGSASRSNSCSGSSAQRVYFHLPERSHQRRVGRLGGVFHRHRAGARAAPRPAAQAFAVGPGHDLRHRHAGEIAERRRRRRASRPGRRPGPAPCRGGDHQRHARRALEEAHLEPQPRSPSMSPWSETNSTMASCRVASSASRISPILSSR
jgi:hypothetical protein